MTSRTAAALLAGAIASVALASPPRRAAGADVETHVLVTSSSSFLPLHALSQGDFEVLSDGQLVAPVGVDMETAPVNLAVLVDLSWSGPWGRAPSAGPLRAAIDAAIVKQLGAADRVRIGSFAGEQRLSAPFPGGSAAWPVDAVAALAVPIETRYGPSPVWDALQMALSTLEAEAGRRAIILFTDGRGTGNRSFPEDVMSHAALADVSISIVPAPDTVFGAQATLIRTLAFQTGGEEPLTRPLPVSGDPAGAGPAGTPFQLFRLQKIEPLLQRLALGARTTYRVSFGPPQRDGCVHAVQVRVRKPGFDVRARQWYRSPAGAESSPPKCDK